MPEMSRAPLAGRKSFHPKRLYPEQYTAGCAIFELAKLISSQSLAANHQPFLFQAWLGPSAQNSHGARLRSGFCHVHT